MGIDPAGFPFIIELSGSAGSATHLIRADMHCSAELANSKLRNTGADGCRGLPSRHRRRDSDRLVLRVVKGVMTWVWLGDHVVLVDSAVASQATSRIQWTVASEFSAEAARDGIRWVCTDYHAHSKLSCLRHRWKLTGARRQLSRARKSVMCYRQQATMSELRCITVTWIATTSVHSALAHEWPLRRRLIRNSIGEWLDQRSSD